MVKIGIALYPSDEQSGSWRWALVATDGKSWHANEPIQVIRITRLAGNSHTYWRHEFSTVSDNTGTSAFHGIIHLLDWADSTANQIVNHAQTIDAMNGDEWTFPGAIAPGWRESVFVLKILSAFHEADIWIPSDTTFDNTYMRILHLGEALRSHHWAKQPGFPVIEYS